jgi:hypothetical protein
MGLGNAMFSGWVPRISLFGDKLTLAGDAALQLRLNFVTGSLFERIGASAGDQHAADRDQDRQGPHLLILGMNFAKANVPL